MITRFTCHEVWHNIHTTELLVGLIWSIWFNVIQYDTNQYDLKFHCYFYSFSNSNLSESPCLCPSTNLESGRNSTILPSWKWKHSRSSIRCTCSLAKLQTLCPSILPNFHCSLSWVEVLRRCNQILRSLPEFVPAACFHCQHTTREN